MIIKSIYKIKTALERGFSDTVPIMPIYDISYVMRSIGKDPRCFITADSNDRINYIEKCFLRHDVDGCFVHIGGNDDWADDHIVEKGDPYWKIINKTTGKVRFLAADGNYQKSDIEYDFTKRSEKVIDNFFIKSRTKESVESSGRYRPLKALSSKYPDHHFSFQISTPIAATIKECGGYEKDLIMLKENEKLFSMKSTNKNYGS